MDQDELSLELKKLLSKVKLKEPPREIMANYLSEVNAKIDGGIKNSHFNFPQFATVFAVGVILAGLFYLFSPRSQVKPVLETKPAVQKVQDLLTTVPQAPPTQVISTQKPLTVEEKMAVLEAFGDEFSDESVDLFGDDEVLEELALLDDMELSPQLSAQASGF